MRLFTAFLLTLLALSVQAQDEALAQQYYQNGEFDKAVVLYEKLFAQKNTPEIYENYLQSLLNLKQFDNAVKVAKKQSRRNEGQLTYEVDQGYVWMQANRPDKADPVFQKLIQEKKKEAPYYLALGSAFSGRELYEYAKQTYLTGRKKLNNENLFQSELAEIYTVTNNKEATINEYLNLLESNEGMLDYVQNMLQSILSTTKEFDLLKTLLNKRISTGADRVVYTELLEWVFVQQKNWDLAFIQAKAIDKRMGLQGDECMRLASLCMENEAYTNAYTIYQYIIGLGKYKPNYIEARIGLLKTASRKTFSSGKYTTADLQALKQDYLNFLNEFGSNENTANVMHDLAELEAFYLDQKSEASTLLEQVLVLGNVRVSFKAECKLMLADIKLLNGEQWEANLLYGQVDHDFKEDPLGQEAKFRNARLSYYQGDFVWAQAQLDILKTATSQLISNNAIELSLLIQDNTVDSIYEPLEMYAAADLLIYQNKFDEAIRKLDSITLLYPYHSLQDEILYLKAQLMYKQHLYEKAVDFYNQVYLKAPEDILADNALWEMARIYDKILNNPEKARQLYEDLILKYPGSMFTVEARKRFRSLRGDILD